VRIERKRPLPRSALLLIAAALSVPACERSGADRAVKEKLEAAQAIEKGERPEEAYPIYEEVLAVAPCNTEALLRLGIRDYVRKDYPRAEERFAACVRCDSNHELCWERLAWTLEKLSRHMETARAYHEANRIRHNREFMDGEGQALIRAGELDDAAAIFGRMIEQYPEDHRSVYFLGNIELKKGNREQAAELYRKAIEMRPVLVEAYQNLASILFEQGRYAEAAALMEKTFEAVPMDAPFDPDLRYNIGVCYLKAGDPDQARKHLEKYLKLAPEGSQAGTVKKLLEGLPQGTAKQGPEEATPRPGD